MESLHLALRVGVKSAVISRGGDHKAAEVMDGHCTIDMNRYPSSRYMCLPRVVCHN